MRTSSKPHTLTRFALVRLPLKFTQADTTHLLNDAALEGVLSGLPRVVPWQCDCVKPSLPSAISSGGSRAWPCTALPQPPREEQLVLGVTGGVGSPWGPALPELEEAQRGTGDESSEGPVPSSLLSPSVSTVLR